MSEDDLPPLLGEDGEELEPAVPAPATASPPAAEPATEPAVARRGFGHGHEVPWFPFG